MPNFGCWAFFENAMTIVTDDCIEWPYSRENKYGYGRISVDGKGRMVHVLACERRHGPRPEGKEARHLCGRGWAGCFNPAHLEWSTRSENFADKLTHGTHQRGERHGLHKLTEDQVAEIRRTYVGVGGPTQTSIAEQFGISRRQLMRIIDGQKWGWLA